MRMIPRVATTRTFNAHERRQAVTTSVAMGRPKIEGLVPFNLRILREQKEALDRICEAERAKRGDPGLTVTDLIREALGAYVRKHDPKTQPK